MAAAAGGGVVVVECVGEKGWEEEMMAGKAERALENSPE
jgi:hypothetical protein